MPRFFNLSVTRNFNKKILVLIRCEPVFSRLYSTSPSSILLKEEKIEAKRMEALKKYGLLDLNLIWPKPEFGSVDHIEKNPASTKQMYAEADLSKLPVFQGGFINYGYWANSFLNKKEITVEQRIACSKEMYRVISNLAQILEGYNVLEVGSGLGYGSSFKLFKPFRMN